MRSNGSTTLSPGSTRRFTRRAYIKVSLFTFKKIRKEFGKLLTDSLLRQFFMKRIKSLGNSL